MKLSVSKTLKQKKISICWKKNLLIPEEEKNNGVSKNYLILQPLMLLSEYKNYNEVELEGKKKILCVRLKLKTCAFFNL